MPIHVSKGHNATLLQRPERALSPIWNTLSASSGTGLPPSMHIQGPESEGLCTRADASRRGSGADALATSEPEDSLNRGQRPPWAEPRSPAPPDFLLARCLRDCINDLHLVPSAKCLPGFPQPATLIVSAQEEGGSFSRSDACVFMRVRRCWGRGRISSDGA